MKKNYFSQLYDININPTPTQMFNYNAPINNNKDSYKQDLNPIF